MSWLAALVDRRRQIAVAVVPPNAPAVAPLASRHPRDVPRPAPVRPSEVTHSAHEIRAQVDPDERGCSLCGGPVLGLTGSRLCELCADADERGEC